MAVDYCGMEVLNISDTGNISLHGWWNPFNCPGNDWFTSASHTNELQYDKNCKQIYLASGKSDMMVVDVTNPALHDSCNCYGGTANGIGTWGISMWHDQIYLSYIYTPGRPFQSNWICVKVLNVGPPCAPLAVDNVNTVQG